MYNTWFVFFLKNTCFIFYFFGFRTGFRPTKGGRLILLVRRGMCTDQALFPLGIEPGIPRVRPWKELLARLFYVTMLNKLYLMHQQCYLKGKMLSRIHQEQEFDQLKQ
jgi:hypothetical protein